LRSKVSWLWVARNIFKVTFPSPAPGWWLCGKSESEEELLHPRSSHLHPRSPRQIGHPTQQLSHHLSFLTTSPELRNKPKTQPLPLLSKGKNPCRVELVS